MWVPDARSWLLCRVLCGTRPRGGHLDNRAYQVEIRKTMQAGAPDIRCAGPGAYRAYLVEDRKGVHGDVGEDEDRPVPRTARQGSIEGPPCHSIPTPPCHSNKAPPCLYSAGGDDGLVREGRDR